MKNYRTTLVLLAALMLAGPAVAQSVEEQREVEVERRMYDAERRMAEAARQMAEMTVERLPQLGEIQRRFEFIGDDKPRLGVTIGGEEQGPVAGVSILAVTPGSAADDAGLRAGDVITSVNGEDLSATGSDAATAKLLDFMAGVEAGDTLEVAYSRDGKSGKVEIEPQPVTARMFAFPGDGQGFHLPSAPHVPGAPGTPAAPQRFVFQWHSSGWGDMELVELNAGLGKYFGTDEGLLVVNAPEAKAWQLEDGDVIQKIDGREPTSVRHALRILSSYQSGESLQIEIMRDKKRRTLSIEMPQDLSSKVAPDVAPVLAPVEKT